MAKETYYFSHDSNAITDTKILNMRADYGLEGYGLYWAIIEMLRNETNYKLEVSKNTYRAIKTLTNTSIDIEKFIKDCIEDYKLFAEKDGFFFSNSLLKRMEQKDIKSAVAREKANKRWNKNNDSNATVMQQQCSSNANKVKEKKEKESKVKENKVNENKRKEIVEIYNFSCPNLPQVQKITDKRKKSIDNFLKDFTIEQFRDICNIANSSDFLTGENKRGWKADFDFIMRTDKALSILEGKYSNSKGGMNDFKDLMEEAKREDEQAGNNTSDNSFSW